jgi:hypothetical protein
MSNPNYYAIIPANVRYNKDLSYLEKFLYCECTALSNVQGYCNAGNEYFAKLYDKDKATISRAISKLQELGFIYIEYERSGARVTKRKIYPLDIKTTNDKIVNGTETTNDKNITREQEKLILTIDKIVKENNVNYNYILNNIIKMFSSNKEKSIIYSFEFTPNCIKAIEDWLQFKKEKNQTYKDKGLETLCKKLYQMQKDSGEQYLINAINHSMANNYAGVYPESKSKPKDNGKQAAKREYTKEEYNNLYDDIDEINI